MIFQGLDTLMIVAGVVLQTIALATFSAKRLDSDKCLTHELPPYQVSWGLIGVSMFTLVLYMVHLFNARSVGALGGTTSGSAEYSYSDMLQRFIA